MLNGTSSDGIGIYAYRDIYAWEGATVVGKGAISGARSVIAHIQAEDEGSSITGISTNINSALSALHADKKMLRAYKKAVVREVYETSELLYNNNPIDPVKEYTTVARNMKNIQNYSWTGYDELGKEFPDGVNLSVDGVFVDEGILTLKGTRNIDAKCGEVTQLKTKGTHEVLFTEIDNYGGVGGI